MCQVLLVVSHEFLPVVIRTVFYCLQSSCIYVHARLVYCERKYVSIYTSRCYVTEEGIMHASMATFSVTYYSYTKRVSASGTMIRYHHKQQQVKLIYLYLGYIYTKYEVSFKISNLKFPDCNFQPVVNQSLSLKMHNFFVLMGVDCVVGVFFS